MIDKIKIIKRNLTPVEIETIVNKSGLEHFDTNGFKHYNNGRDKNFNGGLFINIGIDKKILISGSVHKYATYLKSKTLDNYDSFTMEQAKETLLEIIESTGLNPEKATVNYFEVGLNIVTTIEPKELIKRVYSIGDLDKEKQFFYHAKFKDKSQKTTIYHKDLRVFYKIYDKIHEMLDNRKQPPEGLKIIRIETVHKRVEKTDLIRFCTEQNLKKLQNDFFNNWDKLNFLHEIIAPPQTHTSKIEISKALYKKSQSEVLKGILEQYKNNTISKKIYYNLRTFILNWETEKTSFKPTKSLLCIQWGNFYNPQKQIYTKQNIIK